MHTQTDTPARQKGVRLIFVLRSREHTRGTLAAARWAVCWVTWCIAILSFLGCQSILGIEERALDTDEISERGYRGCEPSRQVCDACTSKWHECICKGWQTLPEAELRLECARDHAPASIRDEVIALAEEEFERYQDGLDEAGVTDPGEGSTDGSPGPAAPAMCREADLDDECLGCFCEHCGDEVLACERNEDCQSIFDCITRFECDPLPVVGTESCYRPEFCGPTIADAGGMDGQGHNLFRRALDCSIQSACPCGDDSGSCWPEAGCECGDCWESCLCEGQPDFECIDRCGDPNCGNDGTCGGCDTCIDDCLCKGQWDLYYCAELCRPGDSCTSERGCFCGSCVDDCTCLGDQPSDCNTWCQPCSLEEGCDCGGDCYNQCYCEGNDVTTCDARCGTGPCSVNGGCNCPDCYSRCLCMGFDSVYCDSDCKVEACSSEGGCFCGNCFDDCTCQGNGTGYCNDLCNPPPCSPVNGCACATCYDTCMCDGFDSTYCNDTCFPPACSPAGGCNCGSCFSDCTCQGNDDVYCNETCYPEACSPAGGCNCGDCYLDCTCAGGTVSQCNVNCGICSVDNGCACGNCYDECTCMGYDANYCNDTCYPPACSVAGGCNCGSCEADCQCYGDDALTCETRCAPGSFSDCADYDACNGCFTCAGSCSCADPSSFASCIQTCEVAGCSPADCSTCQSCQAQCECEGGDPATCLDNCVAMTCDQLSFGFCEECACDMCTTEYRICDETAGCRELMACMTDFECTNVRDCYDPAFCESDIDSVGGLSAPAVQIVEALQLCRVEAGCPCFRSKLEESIDCGGSNCDAYVLTADDPVAPACCSSGPSGPECGLDTRFLLGFDAGCQPLAQHGAPATECASIFPPGLPYNGGEVFGCCRDDGFCGFEDVEMGLGCVPAEVFGITAQTPCTVGDAGP